MSTAPQKRPDQRRYRGSGIEGERLDGDRDRSCHTPSRIHAPRNQSPMAEFYRGTFEVVFESKDAREPPGPQTA